MGRYRSLLTELSFVAAGVACYLLVRALTVDRVDEAVANAHQVLTLERDLGLDWEHAVQQSALDVPWLSTAATQFYFWGYFPTLIVAVVWLYRRHRDSYTTLRNLVLASGAVGFVWYAVYPCAPPRLTDERFVDTLAEAALADVERPIGLTNEIAAMPSFHVGWLVVAAVVVFGATRSPVLRTLCVVVPVAMAYAVVATGNHWVLDVPAGAAIAVAGGLIETGRSALRRPAPPQKTGVSAGAHVGPPVPR